MPIFYYHPENKLSKQLAEHAGVHGFLYQNRGELELRIRRQLTELGYDMWPNFHSLIGSIAGTIDLRIPLNPDNELDRHAFKLCKSNGMPWCYFKIINGPRMAGVVGYCSTGAQNPFGMGAMEQAQRGLSSATYVPRPV